MDTSRPAQEDEYVSLVAVGTGWDLPDEFTEEWTFIDTVLDDEEYVWHIYGQGLALEEDDDCDELLC